ncbi:right-handed parallel beta-helix repeat-containing protein [Dyella caseinilytica]|nr:right-handed parallel beta-helix repeat-containing protein [Dyella caseinilytica]
MDVDVALREGTYRLLQPLQFSAMDSGSPEHPVRWHAAPGAHPVLIGSRAIAGQQRGALWVFPIQSADDLSSVYLDGQRREPSRTSSCSACKVDAKGLSGIPPATMRMLQVGSMVVLHVRWRDFRCAVTALGEDRVTLAQPCWHNTTLDSQSDWRVASPVGKYYSGVDGFENLVGVPVEPGSFTVDTQQHLLLYRPRTDESLLHAVIEIPVAEQLLRLGGTSDAPVHDLTFSGITFSYTGWRKPLSDDGYVGLQAGYVVDGEGRTALPDNGEGMNRIGAAVQVDTGRNIVFDRDTFAHTAAAGIAFSRGTHGAAVLNSHFFDLGGGAIFVGDTEAHPAHPDDKSSDFVIDNNRIDHVAQIYRDNVAIMAGFVNGIEIAHNTISDLPYTGISVGWGWDYEGEAPVQSSIHIVANRIERVMLQLADGGAIYTQGTSTPDTSCIVRNAIDMRHSGEGNGIYLDEHSVNFDVEHNVVLGSWISAWAPWSGHLRMVFNWTDMTLGKPDKLGVTKVWAPNFTGLRVLPAQAQAVQREAGARSGVVAQVAVPVKVRAGCLSGRIDP